MKATDYLATNLVMTRMREAGITPGGQPDLIKRLKKAGLTTHTVPYGSGVSTLWLAAEVTAYIEQNRPRQLAMPWTPGVSTEQLDLRALKAQVLRIENKLDALLALWNTVEIVEPVETLAN